MTANDDLFSIQSLCDRDISVWLDAHEAASASPQWWWGVLEAIESNASIFRSISADQRIDLLNVGARLLVLGGAREDLSPSLIAYWQLRLSVAAMRSDPGLSGLIETLTPEGAARWAVRHMPASREEIISYARERKSRYRDADVDFYAPVGAADPRWGQRDPAIDLLQDAERVLIALEWIDSSRLELTLRTEVESWLEIRSELSM
ncbi:hypothetical protein OHT52_30925 [Streptomyces sp. NBC_00247]|uniref:hypothetical protein n=1 Tax=Streptomyces sp. NBC_00247 TaxID=2975689 RepID=UPI002E2CC43F|nr:hypothetical protein [Streptomyces sp. NBC_00247]